MPQALLASLLLPYQTLAPRSCTLDDSSSSFGVKLPYGFNDDKEREVDVLCVIPSVVQGLDGEHTIFFALTVPGASGYSTMPSERCASERDVFSMYMDLIISIDSINVSACLSHFLIMKYCSHRDSRVFRLVLSFHIALLSRFW